MEMNYCQYENGTSGKLIVFFKEINEKFAYDTLTE